MSTQEDQPTKKPTAERDRYRIVSKIESGGMADIYLGVQVGEKALDRLVVIKKIGTPKADVTKAMGMFLDEAHIVASLNHPHIVKIFDLSKVRDNICITMEYVDGENLSYIFKELAKKNQTVPLRIACQLVIQTCEALQYAHTATAQDGRELNIVHRDLDLRNLMIDRHGYIKIIDFGVAKASTQLEVTSPTIFKGKLSYSAPETFSEPTVDHRADLYALGLVFRQLVTGFKPFKFSRDANVGLIVQTIAQEELPRATSLNKNLPAAIDGLIEKATKKNRDKRFQTATELAEAITDFAEQGGYGIAKSGEVRDWFHGEFAGRIGQRKAFEQDVLEKARQIAEKVAAGELDDDDSIIPDPRNGKAASPPKDSTPPSVPTRKETVPKTVPLKNNGEPSEEPPPARNHTNAIIPAPIATSTSNGQSELDPTPDHGTGRMSDTTQTGPGNSAFPDTGSFGQPGNSLSGDAARPSQMYQDATVHSRVNPYVLAFVVFAMLVAGGFIFQQLFLKKSAPVPSVVNGPIKNPSGAANLLVVSDPNHAQVHINGKKAGTTGPNGLKLRVKSGEMHTIRIAKEGYEVHESVVWGKPSTLTTTQAVLVKIPTESPTAPNAKGGQKTANAISPQDNKPARKPAPADRKDPNLKKNKLSTATTPDEPVKDPEPPKIQQENTWLSETGDWTGAQVASRGCLGCHKDGILLMSKTPNEWRSFFVEKQHYRHKNLSLYFSKREITRVLAYILAKIEKRKEAEQK